MRRVNVSESDLPSLDAALFARPDPAHLQVRQLSTHAPRFLLLYGSLRERSYSRLLAEEAATAAAAAVQPARAAAAATAAAKRR